MVLSSFVSGPETGPREASGLRRGSGVGSCLGSSTALQRRRATSSQEIYPGREGSLSVGGYDPVFQVLKLIVKLFF